MNWDKQASARAQLALSEGFSALDRDRNNVSPGFWSPQEGCYARSLQDSYGKLSVEPTDHRYSPFGLAGALRAHRASGAGNSEHLHKASYWLLHNLNNTTSVDSLYYGGIWALTEAALTFPAETEIRQSYLNRATDLFSGSKSAFADSVDLNFGVGLFALTLLATITPDTAPRGLRGTIAHKAKQITHSLNRRSFPATGDYRAAYHQRLMYSCWGLLGAARLLEDPKPADAAVRILNMVTEHRIDPDGGIRWHAPFEANVTPHGLPGIHPYGSSLYYECHQCFYLISLQLLDELQPGQHPSLTHSEHISRVFNWVFGDNRWGIDLCAHGVPGLPARCVSRKGEISPPPNHFKGCYEVGSWLWQLSNITSASPSQAPSS